MLRILRMSLCLGILFSPLAHAAPQPAMIQEFRAAARVIPSALLAQGYSSVGGIPLQRLLGAMSQVELQPTDWIERAQPMGQENRTARSSAEWQRGSQLQIRLNTRLWAQTPAFVRPALALHEYLGVLAATDDDNYVVSSSLWLLTQPGARATLGQEGVAGLEARIADQASGNGGITGVGGGGDYWGLRTKMLMLQGSLKELKNARNGEERAYRLNSLYGDLYEKTETHWVRP